MAVSILTCYNPCLLTLICKFSIFHEICEQVTLLYQTWPAIRIFSFTEAPFTSFSPHHQLLAFLIIKHLIQSKNSADFRWHMYVTSNETFFLEYKINLPEIQLFLFFSNIFGTF